MRIDENLIITYIQVHIYDIYVCLEMKKTRGKTIFHYAKNKEKKLHTAQERTHTFMHIPCHHYHHFRCSLLLLLYQSGMCVYECLFAEWSGHAAEIVFVCPFRWLLWPHIILSLSLSLSLSVLLPGPSLACMHLADTY